MYMCLKLAAVKKLKRNKAMTIVLLPIIVCLFFAGWLMYWVGEPRGNKRAKITTDHITIGAITLEEEKKVRVQ